MVSAPVLFHLSENSHLFFQTSGKRSLTYQTGRTGRCPEADWKPNNVTCNHGSNTCSDGACIGSICALYGSNECECHQDRDELCHVCCNNSQVSRHNVSFTLKFCFLRTFLKLIMSSTEENSKTKPRGTATENKNILTEYLLPSSIK